MPAVKVGVSRQIAIPKKVFDQLGLEPGDYLEVEVSGNQLILTPKQLIDREIALGLQDFKQGRYIGPFRTGKAAIKALRRAAK